MKRIVLSLIIIAALSNSILQADEQLKLSTTIKPIHSLVSAISGELADTQQIIQGNASPHHYHLKPSDLRKLHSADLLFRIDPKLESFLQKSLRSIDEQKVITLSTSTGLTMLPALESHGHDEHDVSDDEAEELDYHLWLNPDNAIAMASSIRNALSKAAPKHAEQFAKNTEQLINAIRKKDQQIKEQLDEVKDTPFLVMHDAWQYFTKYYELKQLGSISAQERLKPSAKSISNARRVITESKVSCLLTEPNIKAKTLAILTEDLSIKVTEIDPLGREIPQSDSAYPQLLQYIADKLLNCLKKK